MIERAAAFDWLSRCEEQAESIAADARLPKIRDAMTDDAWRDWVSMSISSQHHLATFANARAMIDEGELDEAERLLRSFERARAQLSELAAQWDANAPRRNAAQRRGPRTRWPQLLADELRSSGGRTKKEMWRHVPTSDPGLVVGHDGVSFEIIREDETLLCTDGNGRNFRLKRSSFERHYLKKSDK